MIILDSQPFDPIVYDSDWTSVNPDHATPATPADNADAMINRRE
ncbi:hypothetical protein [Amycolatopsis panacis]|nr:hypothetical protein [Amycolatopsis panacis]